MATITELLARKNGELAGKVSEYNGIVEELNVLRGQDAPDEALVSDKKARKDALNADIDKMRGEIASYEVEARVDAEVARLQATVTEERAPKVEERVQVVSEANPVYRKGDSQTSYFRDIFDAGRGSRDAGDRLARSQESRTATTVAGAGGTFAPPLWLVEDFVAIARAGRVTADLGNVAQLPGGVSSINVPKVTGNSVPDVTETQNTSITQSNFTTTSVSSGIATISARQTVSLELLSQSGVPIDQVILSDLAAGYAVTLDQQVINGSGTAGQLRGLITAGTTVTYTSAAPAVVSTTAANNFYTKVLAAASTMHGARFLAPQAIVMHPRRWAWTLAGLDGANRPIVTPSSATFNAIGQGGAPVAQGYVGDLGGIPVFVDPNIPTNRGASTNQDVVFVLRTSDLWLWESETESASFDATLAAQNSVLFRVLGFAAYIPDRHQASVQVIDGTGLTAPTL
jgi:HK97 family phage major capsid protein